MSDSGLDIDALIAALDAQRKANVISWRELARQTDVSASTLSRMRRGKLPDKEIAVLEKWVKDGLPVTADRLGDIAKLPPKSVVTEEAKKYWVYQPVRRPAVPGVRSL